MSTFLLDLIEWTFKKESTENSLQYTEWESSFSKSLKMWRLVRLPQYIWRNIRRSKLKLLLSNLWEMTLLFHTYIHRSIYLITSSYILYIHPSKVTTSVPFYTSSYTYIILFTLRNYTHYLCIYLSNYVHTLP